MISLSATAVRHHGTEVVLPLQLPYCSAEFAVDCVPLHRWNSHDRDHHLGNPAIHQGPNDRDQQYSGPDLKSYEKLDAKP